MENTDTDPPSSQKPLQSQFLTEINAPSLENKIDSYAKKGLKKVLTDFKMRFTQSVNMAPPPTGHS